MCIRWAVLFVSCIDKWLPFVWAMLLVFYTDHGNLKENTIYQLHNQYHGKPTPVLLWSFFNPPPYSWWKWMLLIWKVSNPIKMDICECLHGKQKCWLGCYPFILDNWFGKSSIRCFCTWWMFISLLPNKKQSKFYF